MIVLYNHDLVSVKVGMSQPFDKTSIQVGVELVCLFIIIFNELLQLRAKIRTVGIRRISGSHIVFCGEQLKEGDGITGLAAEKGVPLSLRVLLNSGFQVFEEGG